MALEVLKGVEEIGGFRVVDMGAIKDAHPELLRPDGTMSYHSFDQNIRPYNFIYVRPDVNSITFNLQNGPIKEVGINGCQIATLIDAAKFLIEKHNEKYPCPFNIETIYHLGQAILFQERRTQAIEARGVEGTSQA